MSILDNTNPQPVTTEQRQAITKQRIRGSIIQLFNQMQTVFQNNFDLVWHHPVLTPQQVLDGLGTDAGELFRLAGLLVDCVNGAKENTITEGAPNQYTVNQDGTVTVGDQIAS